MKHPKPVLAFLAAGLIAMGAAGIAYAEDDDDEGGERGEARSGLFERGERSEFGGSLAAVTNKTYDQECGSCHMAYQPGLLAPQAWAEIMTPAALSKHFGDDASLTEDLRTEISKFLGADSANVDQQANPHHMGAEAAQTDTNALPRISETRSFKREHDEIPLRLVKGNPEIGSFSKCNACHKGATEGNYDEGQINIPGRGPWKD